MKTIGKSLSSWETIRQNLPPKNFMVGKDSLIVPNLIPSRSMNTPNLFKVTRVDVALFLPNDSVVYIFPLTQPS